MVCETIRLVSLQGDDSPYTIRMQDGPSRFASQASGRARSGVLRGGLPSRTLSPRTRECIEAYQWARSDSGKWALPRESLSHMLPINIQKNALILPLGADTSFVLLSLEGDRVGPACCDPHGEERSVTTATPALHPGALHHRRRRILADHHGSVRHDPGPRHSQSDPGQHLRRGRTRGQPMERAGANRLRPPADSRPRTRRPHPDRRRPTAGRRRQRARFQDRPAQPSQTPVERPLPARHRVPGQGPLCHPHGHPPDPRNRRGRRLQPASGNPTSWRPTASNTPSPPASC